MCLLVTVGTAAESGYRMTQANLHYVIVFLGHDVCKGVSCIAARDAAAELGGVSPSQDCDRF